MRRALLALLSLHASGCAYGFAVAQTGHTEPVERPRFGIGVVGVSNENNGEHGGPTVLLPDFSARFGVSDRVDVGVGPWIGIASIRLDVKYALFDRSNKYALAVRVGGGAGATTSVGENSTNESAYLAMVGLVGSYDVSSDFAPYVAATFANHWIYPHSTDAPQPAPGERVVGRKGYGDGLLQLAIGLRLGGREAIFLEYQRWQPMQDDPGDGYRFVASNLGVLVFSF